jgi:hypothetical protein
MKTQWLHCQMAQIPQDYDYKIEHIPGKLHAAADALSRPPGADQDKEDNKAMIMIPESAFIRITDEDSPESLEDHITWSQQRHQPIMKAWEARTPLLCLQTIDGPMWKTQDTQKLAVPPDPNLFREIMKEWHNLPTAGHPGRDKTVQCITNQYHWPRA